MVSFYGEKLLTTGLAVSLLECLTAHGKTETDSECTTSPQALSRRH